MGRKGPGHLGSYDNVTLSHEDRSRILAGKGPGLPFPTGKATGTLLVDGFYRANWTIEGEHGVATLTVDRFKSLGGDPDGTIEQITAEARGLLALVCAHLEERRVEFVPPVPSPA